jgi:hypothetical protein
MVARRPCDFTREYDAGFGPSGRVERERACEGQSGRRRLSQSSVRLNSAGSPACARSSRALARTGRAEPGPEARRESWSQSTIVASCAVYGATRSRWSARRAVIADALSRDPHLTIAPTLHAGLRWPKPDFE